MGMKVHSSQMAGGVVTFVIPFPRLASFTIGKEAFIRRGIDGHPDLTGLPVYPVRMSLIWSAIQSNFQGASLSFKHLPTIGYSLVGAPFAESLQPLEC